MSVEHEEPSETTMRSAGALIHSFSVPEDAARRFSVVTRLWQKRGPWQSKRKTRMRFRLMKPCKRLIDGNGKFVRGELRFPSVPREVFADIALRDLRTGNGRVRF